MPAPVGGIDVVLQAITEQFDQAMKASLDKLDGWEGKAETVAKAAGIAFAAGAGGVAFLTSAFADAEDTGVRAAAAFKAAGQAFDPSRADAFATSLERITRFDDDAIKGAQGMLASFRLTQAQTEAMLPSLTDLAALMKTDLSTAAVMVGRSVQSGSNALARQGVVMDDATEKVFKAASESQRFAMMLDLLQGKAGGVAQTMAGTTAGAFAQLTNALGNLAEEAGALTAGPLSDLARKATEVVNALSSWVKDLSPGMRELIGTGTLVVVAMAGVTAAVAGLAVVLPSVVAGFALLKAGALVALPVLLPIAKALLLIGAAIVGAIATVGMLKKAWESDFLFMRSSVELFVDIVKKVWIGMVSGAMKLWDAFVTWFEQKTGKRFGKAADYIGDKLEGIWGVVETKGQAAIEGTVDLYMKSLETLKTAIGEFGSFMADSFKEGLGVFAPGIEEIKRQIDELMAKLAPKSSGGGDTPGPGGGGGSEKITLWTEAMDKAVQAALAGDRATEAAKDAGVVFWKGMAEKGLQALGDVGTFANSVVQGFMAGGPIGGLVNLGVELLARAPQLEQVIGALSDVIGMAAEALGTIMAPISEILKVVGGMLKPLFEGLGTVLQALSPVLMAVTQLLIPFTPLFEALGDILKALAPLLRLVSIVLGTIVSVISTVLRPVLDTVAFALGILADGFRALTDLVIDVVVGIGGIWNGIVDFVADLLNEIGNALGDFGGWARDLSRTVREGKLDLQSLREGLSGTMPDALPTPGDGLPTFIQEVGFFAAEIVDVTDSIDVLGRAAEEAAGELLNVPSGYKVQLARYGATTPDAWGWTPGMAGGEQTTVNIGTAELKADNPEEMFEKLMRLARGKRYQATGSPLPSGAPFSTPRQGEPW